MEHIKDLFGKYQPLPKKKRVTERSLLIQYFYENALSHWRGKQKLTPSYIGYKLSHLKMLDLYAFKSMCEDRRRNGYPWAKFFWGSLKSHEWNKNEKEIKKRSY